MQYPTRLGRAPLSSNGTFCIISLSLCALILFGLPSSVRGQYETQELPASDGTEGAQIGDSVALDGGRRFTPGELYYGDFGGIWRSRLDGTGAVLAVPFAGASFLALDPVGQKIYWTDQVVLNTEGIIRRANVDGTNVETIVFDLVQPYGIAVDAQAGKIYWVDFGAGLLQRANCDGSGVETLRSTIIRPKGISIDSANAKVYWVDDSGIHRANLNGSGSETVTRVSHASDMDLDLQTGHRYTTFTLRGDVHSTAYGIIASDRPGKPTGITVAQASGLVFWTEQLTDRIYRAKLDGSELTEVLVGGSLWFAIATTSCLLPKGDPDCNSNGLSDTCDTAIDGDCNGNSIPDECDIANGTSADLAANGIPDECESDCNQNGEADSNDLFAGTSADCNLNEVPDECEIHVNAPVEGGPFFCEQGCAIDCNVNGIPDECDISDESSTDFNSNGIPDECEPDPDCNGNGLIDLIEVADGTSTDCNGNFVPDECDLADGDSADCNVNGVPDECDLGDSTSTDCNGNFVPDECDLADGDSADCNVNGFPDECDLGDNTSPDCNSNAIPDECETFEDCNDNGVRDTCDVDALTSLDCNNNFVPDECEPVPDCNANGKLDICDLADFASFDCNEDGIPDECNLADGTSLDLNLDGFPDECDCDSAGVHFAFQPVAASGSHAIDGHDIYLDHGGQLITLEVQIGCWDLDRDGTPRLRAYQAQLDLATFASGGGPPIQYYTPTCLAHSDCYETVSRLTFCEDFGGCTPGYIDTRRPDYVLGNFSVPSVALSDAGVSFSAVSFAGVSEDSGHFQYGGTLLVEVPIEAHGTYTIGFLDEGCLIRIEDDEVFSPGKLTPVRIFVSLSCADVSNCSGNGECVAYNTCDCDLGWEGADCSNAMTGCCTGDGTCETVPAEGCAGTTVPACLGDTDGSGIDDACECATTSPAMVDVIPDAFGEMMPSIKNRRLSFSIPSPPRIQAIRVLFLDLPAPFDVLNGQQMWVGPPEQINESGGAVQPDQDSRSFTAATLQCEPFYTNWNAFGVVHVGHRGIVPEARYTVQTVDSQCDSNDEGTYAAALAIPTSRWGDVAGPFANGGWSGPDGRVDITSDVVCTLEKFVNAAGAPIKARVDLEPDDIDNLINISDVTFVLNAFRGTKYPFAELPEPCN